MNTNETDGRMACMCK